MPNESRTTVTSPSPTLPASGRGAPRRDLTAGPIGRTLLLFALPTLGSNVLQSLNGSINSIWVGRFLGESALAATSNANIIMFLTFGLVFGFGMASTILVGQSIGRRDIEGARRAFGAALALVVGGGVVIAVLGWVFSPEILNLLDTPPEARALALDYLRVVFLGLPTGMLGATVQMSLRGTGDAITPLWFMVLSVVIDAGLNPLLIRGVGPFPEMGIAGSATATLIAGVVSSTGILIYIYARDLPIRLRGSELGYLLPGRALAKVIATKGLPMGAQMLVMSTAGLTMIGLVNRLGVETAAAYAVSQQLWIYIQMPAMAIGAAVSAMAAQNIGAGRWERVDRITRSGIAMNTVITLTVILVIILFDRPLMALFVGSDSLAIPIARHIQLLSSWTFLAFGATMVLFATSRANGATVAPLIILFIALYPVRIGIAYGGVGRFGPDALWLAFPIGSVAALAMATWYYRRGSWRKQTLGVPPDQAEGEEQSHATSEPAGRLQPSG